MADIKDDITMIYQHLKIFLRRKSPMVATGQQAALFHTRSSAVIKKSSSFTQVVTHDVGHCSHMRYRHTV
ncbi:hypothetical protein CEXT_622071 [Caerostris extrusa]|uniref:Uncharacterized protein n=1 Tax=Caerostris extrusa TaxID=172846 RepID=A0AAV4WWI5_CAEEX|nr:hypothetical protein CEXT_622071 [Caerostris extrusa]